MSILFITSTHIGDAILSSGLLARIMDDYPDDGVTIACGAPAAKVFEAVPRLESIHVIRKRRYSLHWPDLWRKAFGRRWRVLVDLRRSPSPFVLRAARKYTLPKAKGGQHRVALISSAIGSPPLDPRIWVSEEHAARGRTLIDGNGPVLAVAPGANWPGKIWPAERFVELARRLTAPDAVLEGGRILVVGSKDERPMAQPIFDALPAASIIDGLGTDVLSTYAALQGCRLFVGNDSAMMHLAAATGRPTVGLFGPTRDDHYAPWGENGLVVRTPESISDLIGGPEYDTRTTGSMMTSLTAEAVEAAVLDRWGNDLAGAD